MTALAERPQTLSLAQPGGFSTEQIDLIKNTVAVGTTDLELALFLEVCRTTGLNPFQKQVYAVVRKSKAKVNGQWTETSKMVIQTGIDGYRLIASRSSAHLGTTDPEFGPLNKEGFPESARVIVRKLVQGHIAEFPATARWAEYVQTKAEYSGGSATGKQIVSDMWAKMPHTMLGKCAESLALRKAFPAELSGVYSDVEMAQADNTTAPAQVEQAGPSESERLDKAVKAIGQRLGECQQAGNFEAAQALLKGYAYRSDLEAATNAYRALKPLTVALVVEVEPVEAEVVSSPDTITDGQRKALMAQMKRVGIAENSQRRAQLWAYALNDTIPPTATNDLSSENAQTIIDILKAMNPTEAQEFGAEFSQKVVM
jgi:phage recombination protein Bet